MVELLASMNWWAVLAATVVYFMLGALWYSPLLFARKWMSLRELTDDDIGDPNPMIFLWAFLLQFIAVSTLGVLWQAMGDVSLGQGAWMGFGVGAGILFCLTGNSALFSETKLPLHVIDNGYHVVALSLAGLILAFV